MSSIPHRRLKPKRSDAQPCSATTRSRSRIRPPTARLALKRIVGNTCSLPTTFHSSAKCFAYVAGAVVVVVTVGQDEQVIQRFYRARPTVTPAFPLISAPQISSNPVSGPPSNAGPKASGVKKRTGKSLREALLATPTLNQALPANTWTSRERVKAATCVSLSPDQRFLAVGETGYAPRVLIFGLEDGSSDIPLVSINEHGFGVKAVAWSNDGEWLASLGTASDGFLYVWKIDPRTGSAMLFKQNRCTSNVTGMIWLRNYLITFGLRHVKAWKVIDEPEQPVSPSKSHLSLDSHFQSPPRTLPGRNVVLGPFLETRFACASAVDDVRAVLCSDNGYVCLLDGTVGSQMKLIQLVSLGFPLSCCVLQPATEQPIVWVCGRDGQLLKIYVESMLHRVETAIKSDLGYANVLAVGFMDDRLVTMDANRNIDIWRTDVPPKNHSDASASVRLVGQNTPVLGVKSLKRLGQLVSPAFFTWSGSGEVLLWDPSGCVMEQLKFSIDEVYTGKEMEIRNQVCVVTADEEGHIFAGGDRIGVLMVLHRPSGKMLLKVKAHSSEITHIAVRYDAARALVATSSRDRTVQLFQQTSEGSLNLSQTLEFPARVNQLTLSSDSHLITSSMDRTVQIHNLKCNLSTLVAVPCRSIALRATPVSVALDSQARTLLVSSADKAVQVFELDSGRLLKTFKCVDEKNDTVVLESLVTRSMLGSEAPLLFGLSNNDKSVRIYECEAGLFINREWGHTDSISGIALVQEDDFEWKLISAGCDGTIIIFDVEQNTSRALLGTSMSHLPTGARCPPLRRVLSKPELATLSGASSLHSDKGQGLPEDVYHEHAQKDTLLIPGRPRTPAPSAKSDAQTQSRRTTPDQTHSSLIDTDTTSARSVHMLSPLISSDMTAVSQLQSDLRSACDLESLKEASDHICHQLRAFRSKLSSNTSVTAEALMELEAELRHTSIELNRRLAVIPNDKTTLTDGLNDLRLNSGPEPNSA